MERMMAENSRSGAKSALVRIFSNGRESICNDRDEKIDEPEVEHNDTDNEEEAGDEEFGIHHLVHQRRPLF